MPKRKRMKKVHITKTECRYRQKSPKLFDPRSFRSKRVSKRTRLIVACPKGKYRPAVKRCVNGMQLQSVIKKKTAAGTCPR